MQASSSSLSTDPILVADIMVTCNRATLLHYQWDYTNQRLLSPTTVTSSSFSSHSLVSSVRDLAWCPLKNGTENAFFLSACRSQPLQLFHLYSPTTPEVRSLEKEEGDAEVRMGGGKDVHSWMYSRRSPCTSSTVAATIPVPHVGDGVCDPTAVTWWCTPGYTTAGTAAVGYHVAEDPTTIRFFDMQRVLESSPCRAVASPVRGGGVADAMMGSYRSPLAKPPGPVSVLHSSAHYSTRIQGEGGGTAIKSLGQPGGTHHRTSPCRDTSSTSMASASSSILFAGFHRHAHVEVIDERHCCPAAILHPPRCGTSRSDPHATSSTLTTSVHHHSGGVMRILTHPDDEHVVVATGRSGSRFMYGWDLRQPLSPLYHFTSPSCDGQQWNGDHLQRSDLAWIPRPSSSFLECGGSSYWLCSTTSTVLHDDERATTPARGNPSPAASIHKRERSDSRGRGERNEKKKEIHRGGGGGLAFYSLPSPSGGRLMEPSTDARVTTGTMDRIEYPSTSVSSSMQHLSSVVESYPSSGMGPTNGLAVLPPSPFRGAASSPPQVLLVVISSQDGPPLWCATRVLRPRTPTLPPSGIPVVPAGPSASVPGGTRIFSRLDSSTRIHRWGTRANSLNEKQERNHSDRDEEDEEEDDENDLYFYQLQTSSRQRTINKERRDIVEKDEAVREGSSSAWSTDDDEEASLIALNERPQAGIHVISIGG